MDDFDGLRRKLTQRLETLQRAGVTHVPRVPVVAPSVQSNSSASQTPKAQAGVSNDSPSAIPSATPLQRSPESPTSVEMPRRATATGRNKSLESAQDAPARGQSVPSSPALASAAPLKPLKPSARANSPGESSSLEARKETLEVLRANVCQCRKCPVLVANRTQTVFGVGNLQPRLCFFGEAPGADEDAQGEPFVGKSGQFLNQMIEAMTLRREDVYILNVLKCRPPDNRPPLPEEAENCRPFFERQLEVLRPEFICCLGASAAQTLLKSKLSIGKLRGQFFDYGTSKVIPTYHPSYIFRNPSAKRPLWEDLQKLMAAMGLERRT